MKKLEIELVKIFDTGLAMRVIHQDESLRRLEGSTTVLYYNKFYTFKSCNSPALESRSCYIRGDWYKDDRKISCFQYSSQSERDAMYDFIIEAMEHINNPEPLTFERIRKECVPMKHLLVDEAGHKRLYLGFNRRGKAVTDCAYGCDVATWYETSIKDWTIEEYKEGGK